MVKLLQIRLFKSFNNTDKNKNIIAECYNDLIEKAKELNIWDKSITAIIITDDFEKEVEKQAIEWSVNTSISREKEFYVASKVVYNHNQKMPEYHIFFNFRNFYDESFSHKNGFFSQILNIYSNKIIPIEIRDNKIKKPLLSLDDNIIFASIEWCKKVHSIAKIKELHTINQPIMHSKFFLAFKRKLKKNLFEYNSDHFDSQKRLDVFWYNYFESINTFFLRLVENDCISPKLKITEESCNDLIYTVVQEIKNLTQRCLDKKEYDIIHLKEAIIKFSAYFEVFLEDETDTNFRIRLTKNPKDYFINDLVETEPRIVCFMDILGFSDMIKEYDIDATSTLLQDIQESFALTKAYLLENKFINNQEWVSHLEYQTFSDNICISIPYFDNESDFLTSFNLLSVYVRSFQMIMMTKSIFLRGGISLGSYFADNNIIFSKGLVNAYYLESKKAIYPRVIIDNTIILKLLSYNYDSLCTFGLENLIIFDWENVAFINPFGFLDSSINQLETVLSEFDVDDNPLDNIINSFTKEIGSMAINMMKTFTKHEKDGLHLIKNKVQENIYTFNDNKNVVSKYLWLMEFIKWYEKDDQAKLKFQYFSIIFKDIHSQYEKYKSISC